MVSPKLLRAGAQLFEVGDARELGAITLNLRHLPYRSSGRDSVAPACGYPASFTGICRSVHLLPGFPLCLANCLIVLPTTGQYAEQRTLAAGHMPQPRRGHALNIASELFLGGGTLRVTVVRHGRCEEAGNRPRGRGEKAHSKVGASGVSSLSPGKPNLP